MGQIGFAVNKAPRLDDVRGLLVGAAQGKLLPSAPLAVSADLDHLQDGCHHSAPALDL